MKKDIRIKITNDDGSCKQSTTHEIFPESFSCDPLISSLAEEAIKKFKASGELPDEIIITETYFYG